MPSALILISDGTEEMEFTITYDTLIRAGVSCTSAFVPPSPSKIQSSDSSVRVARCSRGIMIVPDTTFSLKDSGSFDAVVIPGGAKGAETMSQSTEVQSLVRDYLKQDKIVGMICAGSLTALTAKLTKQPLTSHPSVKSQLENDFDYSEEPVVVYNKLVTSRGPGTAFLFALTLVEMLCGPEKRTEVRGPMVFPPNVPF